MMYVVHVLLLVLAAHSAESTACGGLSAGTHTCFVAQFAPNVGEDVNSFCLYPSGAKASCRVGSRLLLAMRATPSQDPSRDGGLEGKRFVSRTMTDALMAAQPAPVTLLDSGDSGRPSKRALVRKAASRVVSAIISAPRSLTRRLFGTTEPPPMMGVEAEASGMADVRTAPVSGTAGASQTQRLAAEAKAEDERVFDLLNKYSQRHSNGTVRVTATLSSATERKQVQKSKYANLYDPEQDQIKKSKSGKVLQKSRYADLWSAQDQIVADSRPQSATQPVASTTKRVSTAPSGTGSIKRQQSMEPPSRLDQLMSSYSNRYPNDARYSQQEENQLLRRAPKNPAASLTSDSINEAPKPVILSGVETSAALTVTEIAEASALSEIMSDSREEESMGEESDDDKYAAGARSQGTGGTTLSAMAAVSELPTGLTHKISRMQLRKSLPLQGKLT